MIPRPLAKDVVDTTLAWFKLAAHRRIADIDILAIRLAGDGDAAAQEPWFATVLGGAASLGISCHQGLEGLRSLREALGGNVERARLPKSATLTATMEPPGKIREEMLEVARSAGQSGRLVPVYFGTSPGKKAHALRPAELKELVLILEALTLAETRGLLHPVALCATGPARLLTLTASGKGKTLDVGAKYETFVLEPVAGDAGQGALPAELYEPWEYGVADAEWAIGFAPLPAGMTGSQQQLFGLEAVDTKTGQPRAMQLVLGADVDAAISELRRLWKGSGGIPKQVAFTSAVLFERLQPLLAKQGSECRLVASHAQLDRFRSTIAERLLGSEAEAVPDASDQAGWRAADTRLRRRLHEHKGFAASNSLRVRALYFGWPVTTEQLAKLGIEVAERTYAEWFYVHHRDHPGARTVAERVLAGELPEVERKLLLARVAGSLGIWRVDSIEGPRLGFTDILSDQRASVEDGALAAAVHQGMCLPAQVCSVGEYRFVVLLGPPLGEQEVERALARLVGAGEALTAEGLRESPHLPGRLWVRAETGGVGQAPKRASPP